MKITPRQGTGARLDAALALTVVAASCAVLLWHEAVPMLRWLLYASYGLWVAFNLASLHATGALYTHPMKLPADLRRRHGSALGLVAAVLGAYVMIRFTL